MKNILEVKRSASARLKQAIKLTQEIGVELNNIKKKNRVDGDLRRMEIIRKKVNRLNQCIHEFNAYETTYLEQEG